MTFYKVSHDRLLSGGSELLFGFRIQLHQGNHRATLPTPAHILHNERITYAILPNFRTRRLPNLIFDQFPRLG
jgi:hypothetical protein